MSKIVAVAVLLAAAFPVGAQDRVTAIPDTQVLLDNECVRVQYDDIAVGQKTPMHSHPNFVVYVLNPGRVKVTLPDGSQRIKARKAGEVFWSEATQHTVENIGSTPIHNLVVELKPGAGCH